MSGAVFTSKNLLPVALVFRSTGGEELDLDKIVRRSPVPQSSVHRELQKLVLIGAVERVRHGRDVRYRKDRTALFWQWFEDLLAKSVAPAIGDRATQPGRRR
jgi:hypothetical protein